MTRHFDISRIKFVWCLFGQSQVLCVANLASLEFMVNRE